MLAARRAARDALSEMSAQNARLVSAYVEKKAEAAALREELAEARRVAEVGGHWEGSAIGEAAGGGEGQAGEGVQWALACSIVLIKNAGVTANLCTAPPSHKRCPQARARALEAELSAAQAQSAELRGRLQQAGQLPASPELDRFRSPSAAKAASELRGLGAAFAAAFDAEGSGTVEGEESAPDLEFASPFSTPVRNRTPPSTQQQQQQQQQGKENASWSGNRGGCATVPRRKPAGLHDSEHGEGGATPGRPASVPRQPKGEWDKERSELLSLLERLQRQLSAHGEQQQGTPPRAPAPATHQPAQQQQQQQQQQPPAGPPPAESEGLPGGASPGGQYSAPGAQPSPSPLHTEDAPSPPEATAATPPSRRSTMSSGPTPRQSHFSIPRQSRSEPPSQLEQEEEEEGFVAGSSRRSSQPAAGHSRRTSAVNLSQAFEGARSGAGSGGGSLGSGAAGPCSSGIGDRSGGASTPSDASGYDDAEGPGRPRGPRPTSAEAAAVHLSSPSSASACSGFAGFGGSYDEEEREEEYGDSTPLGPDLPGSPRLQQPSPIIPPTATPFATPPPEGGTTEEQQQEQSGRASGGRGSGSAAAAGSGGANPEEQHLADVERRNVALEVGLGGKRVGKLWRGRCSE